MLIKNPFVGLLLTALESISCTQRKSRENTLCRTLVHHRTHTFHSHTHTITEGQFSVSNQPQHVFSVPVNSPYPPRMTLALNWRLPETSSTCITVSIHAAVCFFSRAGRARYLWMLLRGCQSSSAPTWVTWTWNPVTRPKTVRLSPLC